MVTSSYCSIWDEPILGTGPRLSKLLHEFTYSTVTGDEDDVDVYFILKTAYELRQKTRDAVAIYESANCAWWSAYNDHDQAKDSMGRLHVVMMDASEMTSSTTSLAVADLVLSSYSSCAVDITNNISVASAANLDALQNLHNAKVNEKAHRDFWATHSGFIIERGSSVESLNVDRMSYQGMVGPDATGILPYWFRS
jgi:hypothetical protein